MMTRPDLCEEELERIVRAYGRKGLMWESLAAINLP
jgi:hypothetical protein